MLDFLKRIKFPLEKNGEIDDWLYQHALGVLLLFAVLFRISGSFGLSCLIAGAFFPVRALVWKAPWAPGHDVNDPFSDYGWGAAVPAAIMLLVYLMFR